MLYATLPKSVLGLLLLLFVQQSDQQLQTGYNYEGDTIFDEDVLHGDLRCTFLFGGLTHMLVTKRLADPPIRWHPSLIIGRLIQYGRVVKGQIDSLHRLKVGGIDSLWALHLYLSLLNGFFEKSENKREDGRKIYGGHGFVVDELRKDLVVCRRNNSYNHEANIMHNRNMTEHQLIRTMEENANKAKVLFTRNNICGQSFNDYVGQTLKTGHLLLNNIGSKSFYLRDLMDMFNVQVNWSDAIGRLYKSWQDAHHILDWADDKLAKLKSYYELTFNMLKIIIARLTVKHLNYLETFPGTGLFMNYVKLWYDLVLQFADTLSLSKDLHVKHLLGSLDDLVKGKQTISRVAESLNPILEALCLPLGCDATGEIILNGEEFGEPYKKSVMTEMDRFVITESSVAIEYHSLENTRAFLYYLKCVFKYIDFDLVQSLVDYVNKLNP